MASCTVAHRAVLGVFHIPELCKNWPPTAQNRKVPWIFQGHGFFLQLFWPWKNVEHCYSNLTFESFFPSKDVFFAVISHGFSGPRNA
jgi:hypothetical protein